MDPAPISSVDAPDDAPDDALDDSPEHAVYAVVTGGGTSGHVIPAIAVLEALEDSGHPAVRLAFVGCTRGVDRTSMDESGLSGRGVRCVYLSTSGLQRGLSFAAVARNVAFPWRVLAARRTARRLVRQWRPRVVVSVGGYASDPMSHAAVAAGVPLVCVSYDRVPGLATRVQSRRAAACAVAFPDSALPRAVHTGAPVRRALRRKSGADPAAARRELGLPVGGRLVAVVGGSLGSGVLNDSVQRLLADLAERETEPVAVLHLCGRRFSEHPAPTAPDGVTYVRRPQESRMSEVYAAVDVLVCRAGASTVAEIAATGTAAVLVPWSDAADDHQRLNARWLGEAGAAVVLDESLGEALAPAISAEVLSLLDDHARRAQMAERARTLGEPSRGVALVDLVEASAACPR